MNENGSPNNLGKLSVRAHQAEGQEKCVPPQQRARLQAICTYQQSDKLKDYLERSSLKKQIIVDTPK